MLDFTMTVRGRGALTMLLTLVFTSAAATGIAAIAELAEYAELTRLEFLLYTVSLAVVVIALPHRRTVAAQFVTYVRHINTSLHHSRFIHH